MMPKLLQRVKNWRSDNIFFTVCKSAIWTDGSQDYSSTELKVHKSCRTIRLSLYDIVTVLTVKLSIVKPKF